MASEITIDEMWRMMEDSGIDRKMLESTKPSKDLLFRLYLAVKQEKESSDFYDKAKKEFVQSDPMS
ncbi:MAG TPA: hypothetical protein VJ792_01290 [Candidatus Nitrosotalea sp.]|nr:hypothetical protein [Candidatus Nitrosotalea sp.]